MGSTSTGGEYFSGADVYKKHLQMDLIKVEVGTQVFYAHEGILSKSSVLEELIANSLTPTIPGGHYTIKLPDYQPETFSSILEFLYADEYSPKFDTSKKVYNQPSYEKSITGYPVLKYNPNEVLMNEAAMRHAKIYRLADMLGMIELQKLALEKLRFCGPIKGLNFLNLAHFLMTKTSEFKELKKFLEDYAGGIP